MVDINKSQNASSFSEPQSHIKTSNSAINLNDNIKIIKFNILSNTINSQKTSKRKLPSLYGIKTLKHSQIHNLFQKSNSFNISNPLNNTNQINKNFEIIKTPLKNNSCNFEKNTGFTYKLQTQFFKSSFTSSDSLDIHSTKNSVRQNFANFYANILQKKPKIKLVEKNPTSFHRTLMNSFEIKQKKRINDFYNKLNLEENIKFINEVLENKKEIKTGIFGPNNNKISAIRARMERIKYDKQYKIKNQEIKDIIEDEILDAQLKLKRKPIKINFDNPSGELPLYLQKIDNYRYLKKFNNILFFNKQAKIPVILDNGETVIRLVKDAVNVIKSKKYDLKTRDNIK